MPLDGTYQAHTSTHMSQTQAGLPSACMCWAKPCCHLSSLTASTPSSAFASPPTQGPCQKEETPQGETLLQTIVEQSPPSTRAVAELLPSKAHTTYIGQQQSPESFPRGCRLLTMLARDSGRNGDICSGITKI